MSTDPASDNLGTDQGSPAPRPQFVVAGESFDCVTYVPQWNLMRLAAAMDSNNDMKAMGAMYAFIKRMVIEDEHERLEDHLGSLDLDVSSLEHCIGDALVEMAGRGKGSGVPKGIPPSGESSGSSSDGSPEAPPTSRVVSLSRGTVEVVPVESTGRHSLTD
jgi:hypothetical protein